ncbi:hypothetical protein V2J09_007233 [Rumex salicifolius]
MPSLQTALPPELANNAIRLYRECLRRAKYIGSKQHNAPLLIEMVRQQFKRNMLETDPEKIKKLKDDAARGLINHMLYESEKTSGRKLMGRTIRDAVSLYYWASQVVPALCGPQNSSNLPFGAKLLEEALVMQQPFSTKENLEKEEEEEEEANPGHWSISYFKLKPTLVNCISGKVGYLHSNI